MRLNLHTTSRDNLFEATAIYNDGMVTVKKGSRVKIHNGPNFKPSQLVESLLGDKTVVDPKGYLLKDVSFDSLSTAATFVAGRISNGMITWKTEDGKYVKYTLKKE